MDLKWIILLRLFAWGSGGLSPSVMQHLEPWLPWIWRGGEPPYCPPWNSCEGRCEISKNSTNSYFTLPKNPPFPCHCDSLCWQNGLQDCCPDFWPSCCEDDPGACVNNDNTIITHPTFLVDLECFSLGYPYGGVWVARSCLPHLTHRDNHVGKMKYDEDNRLLPLTGLSGITYWNREIATCRNEAPEAMYEWYQIEGCLMKRVPGAICEFRQFCWRCFLMPPSGPTPRMCTPTIDNCPANITMPGNMKETASAPVIVGDTLYKNPSIAECHGYTPGEYNCPNPTRYGLAPLAASSTCHHPMATVLHTQSTTVRTMASFKMFYGNYMDIPPTFSILWNYGTTGYKQVFYSNHIHDCDGGHMWDPFAQVCRPIYCTLDSQWENYACATLPASNNTGQSNAYNFISPILLVTFAVEFAVADIDTQTQVEICAEFPNMLASYVDITADRILNTSLVITGYKNLTESSPAIPMLQQTTRVTLADLKFLLTETTNSTEATNDVVMATLANGISLNTLVTLIAEIPAQVIGLHEDVPSYTVEELSYWCRDGQLKTYRDNEFDLQMNDTEMMVYIYETSTWYDTGEFVANLVFQGNAINNATLTGSVTVCANRSSIDNCPMVVLNASSFEWINGTLYYTGPLQIFPEQLEWGSYQLVNNNIYVCIKIPDIPGWPTALQSYLSLVLTCISLVALLFTMLTYLGFRELQNLPGLTILHLTTCTFVFHLTFLIGMRQVVSDDKFPCQIIAIVIHYQGLVSFLWTNVMAWDLYQTFGKTFNQLHKLQKHLIYYYASYAYGVPLLIVLIAVALQFGSNSSLSPGYGFVYCWISNPLASLVFFALPIGLALTANGVLFGITIARIHKTSGEVRSGGLVRKGRSEIRLYGRMCTVLGFTWFFGLTASLFTGLACTILTYIYVILNSLQGLFITLAFTCNSRIVTLYKRTWGRLQRKLCPKCLQHPCKCSVRSFTSSLSSSRNSIPRY